MRWVGHVARMGEERGCIGSWWGNRREGDYWGDLGIGGWIMLGWISRRRSTCFSRVFRPSSGAQNCTYSVRHVLA